MKKLFLVPLMAAFALGTLSMTSCGSDKDKPAPKPTPEKPDPNKPDPNKPDPNKPSNGEYDESRIAGLIYLPKDFASKAEIMAAYDNNANLKAAYENAPLKDDQNQEHIINYNAKENAETHFALLQYVHKPSQGVPFLYAAQGMKPNSMIDDNQANDEEKYAGFYKMVAAYAKIFGLTEVKRGKFDLTLNDGTKVPAPAEVCSDSRGLNWFFYARKFDDIDGFIAEITVPEENGTQTVRPMQNRNFDASLLNNIK